MSNPKRWLDRARVRLVVAALLLGCSGVASASPAVQGRVAVWHHRRVVAKAVELPAFVGDRPFADDLVRVGPLPESLVTAAVRCYCFRVDDDRMAFVQTYYYAHQFLADYDALLREAKLPQLKDVHILLFKDKARPAAYALRHDRKHALTLTYSAPAIDPFTIASGMAQVMVQHLVPRHLGPTAGDGGDGANGPKAALAAILAALNLGQTGNLAGTADTLDGPPQVDVDTFVRFPDMVMNRRASFKQMRAAPRFAARFPEYVDGLNRSLRDPETASRVWLGQPDPNSAAAVITQPLWQAALRFGEKPTKLLVLATLSQWDSRLPSYSALARQLVRHAAQFGPRWSKFLTDEYRRRGLSLTDEAQVGRKER